MEVAINTTEGQFYGHIPIELFISDIRSKYDISPAEANSLLRCFCPIHKDRVFRTLVIDLKKQMFKCSYTHCAGFRGGSLIDLFVIVFGCTYDDALDYWDKKVRGKPASLDQIRSILPEESPDNLIDISTDTDIRNRLDHLSGSAEIKTRENLTIHLTPYDNFMDQVQREIKRARRYDYPVSLLLMEIRGTPDSHGNKAKEDEEDWRLEILDAVSRVIRSSDTASYYGVNKIALLLPQINADQAAIVARRLQTVIREIIRKVQVIGAITPWIYFGIACCDENDDKSVNSESLMSKAIDQLWEYSTNKNKALENKKETMKKSK